VRSAAEIGERVRAGLEAAWSSNRARGAPLREMVADILAKAPHSKNYQVRNRLPLPRTELPSQRHVNRVIASVKKGDTRPSCPIVECRTIIVNEPKVSHRLPPRYRMHSPVVPVVDEFDPLASYKDREPRENQLWEPEST